ncbi:hypothetical protein [Fischerella sp. JS2]|uniref:hypothetical protein n=1 Tax=Fischerella sp. JS2 TaxID=2597771 RepID=UPI0028F14117|nr:hypothetical protein [Fischerella sp. JS2]
MKIKKILINFRGRLLLLNTFFLIGLLSGLTFFSVDIFRARVIDIDEANQLLEAKKQKENNSFGVTKVLFSQGSSDKGIDLRCLSWSSKFLYSGWSDNPKDHDYFIDHYIPAGKKAIICATPALSAALAVHPRKKFLYEVSKIDLDDGLYVRVVVGVSEAREPCKLLTGSVDCMNSILARQAVVKYEP